MTRRGRTLPWDWYPGEIPRNARVHDTALAHEFEHPLGLLPACLRPDGARRARMHQRVQLARDEAVVDEEVLLDAEPCVAAFEVAGPVVLDAMAQGQVLRACRRADRVGLHEAQFRDRAAERGRVEEGAAHRVAAQVIQSDRHPRMMPIFDRPDLSPRM